MSDVEQTTWVKREKEKEERERGGRWKA